MNFLNPLVLFGLIAASIPLILHLINLRKLKQIEFSSLKFIKEMQKTKIRRIKLKQILLLILRTLIITFIVLAFARPTVSTNLPLIGTYANTDIVILVDNSSSMDLSDEFGNRFTQAKNIAKDIVKNMIDGDKAIVLAMNGSNTGFSDFSSSKTTIIDEISKIGMTQKTANLDNSIRQAFSLIEKTSSIRKEIIVISDAQPNTFLRRFTDEKKYYYPNTSVFYVPVGLKSNNPARNISIDSLTVLTKIIQTGQPVEVKAYLNNHSQSDISGLVTSLYLNGSRVAQRPVDLSSGKTNEIILSGNLPITGIVSGYLEIENDDLEFDNKRYFSLFIPDKPHIAIFGNADDVMPLRILLSSSEILNRFEFFNTSQIQSVDFSTYDLIVFASGPYREQDITKAKEYTGNGGAAILFADRSPAFLEGMSGFGFGTVSVKNLISGKENFDYTDNQHPIFDGVFKGSTDNKKNIESAQIYQLAIPAMGQKIISSPSGNFLTEARLGKGKIFFFSVGLGNDWSNFTTTGIFPVLIYRSIIYLTSKELIGRNFLIGEPVRLVLPSRIKSESNYKVTDPNNLESFVQNISVSEQPAIGIDPVITGNFSVKDSRDNHADNFSVNSDPTESRISKSAESDIVKELEKIVDDKNEIKILVQDNLTKDLNRARTGSELWQFLIVMALLTAIAEMIVARTIKNDNQ
jgi:hypothetical protein